VRPSASHGADQKPSFVEYLRRALAHLAPLTRPADLAWLLASYARDALARVETVNLPELETVRTGLEQALGLRFEGPKGEHFFRSTLVQTLFYGVFSAWVQWCKDQPPGSTARFDWHMAEWSLHVPMVRTIYEQVATPGQLRPLGLVEVLDWAGAALNRVDRAAFFASFDEGLAVQYFYEPFLASFDPEVRKQLGVWYTPPEVVRYMVARVDAVLESELGVAAGLADPNVYVLDPCCGTGSFLVESLRRIGERLRAQDPCCPRPQAGSLEPGVRLGDHAGALRHRALANRPPAPGRAVRGGGTRRGLPHQRTDRLAAATGAEAALAVSRDGGRARRGRAR
jgi:N-6 DNA Methylase